MEDCVGFFSSLYSTSQLPWSAWAVPPCCVCLPLLSSPMSHPCSSLPWFPWQSCATSSRSTSEWHPGKKEPRASPFRQWKWSLQCRRAVQGSFVFKFGPVEAVALSASGTNPLQWKCHFTSAFGGKQSFWEAWAGVLCMIKGFWSSQKRTSCVLSSPKGCVLGTSKEMW